MDTIEPLTKKIITYMNLQGTNVGENGKAVQNIVNNVSRIDRKTQMSEESIPYNCNIKFSVQKCWCRLNWTDESCLYS